MRVVSSSIHVAANGIMSLFLWLSNIPVCSILWLSNIPVCIHTHLTHTHTHTPARAQSGLQIPPPSETLEPSSGQGSKHFLGIYLSFSANQ